MASLLPEPGHDKLSAVVILGSYDKLMILAMRAFAAADSVDLPTIPTAESVVVSTQATSSLECRPAVFKQGFWLQTTGIDEALYGCRETGFSGTRVCPLTSPCS